MISNVDFKKAILLLCGLLHISRLLSTILTEVVLFLHVLLYWYLL